MPGWITKKEKERIEQMERMRPAFKTLEGLIRLTGFPEIILSKVGKKGRRIVKCQDGK